MSRRRAGREVTGANVLVAMFAERESHAAYFLQEQNMTRFDAVNYISHWHPKSGRGFASRPSAGSHSSAGLGEGVLGREWGIRGPMAAPYKPPGGPGWGIWGPVHY
jgi:ATP-dependent Clp protease ATP-binding subunit ClpA